MTQGKRTEPTWTWETEQNLLPTLIFEHVKKYAPNTKHTHFAAIIAYFVSKSYDSQSVRTAIWQMLEDQKLMMIENNFVEIFDEKKWKEKFSRKEEIK